MSDPTPEGQKPFENEHSCRLQDPDEFDTFRRENDAQQVDGKSVDFIFGLVDDDSSELQAIRYPLDEGWAGDSGKAAARAHCEEQDSIMFEPADPEGEGDESESATAEACGACGPTNDMRTTKSPGGSTVTKTTHAESVVTRDVDGEDIEMLRVPISSTHRDRDGDAFSEAALRGMAEQIRGEKPLVHDDHGAVGGGMFSRYPARETIGTQMDAEVEEGDDDHHTLYAFINPDGSHPEGEGDRMLSQVKDEKQAIKFSVGFGILRTADDMPEDDRPERANEIPGQLFMETDLMETSRVGIPANPMASAEVGAKDGAIPGMEGRVPVAYLTPDQLAQVDSDVVGDATPTRVDGQPGVTAKDAGGDDTGGNADPETDTDHDTDTMTDDIDSLADKTAFGRATLETWDDDDLAALRETIEQAGGTPGDGGDIDEPDPGETDTGSAGGPTDDELRARVEALEESIKEGTADPETAATATTEPDLTDDATTDAEADGGPEETDETDDTPDTGHETVFDI